MADCCSGRVQRGKSRSRFTVREPPGERRCLVRRRAGSSAAAESPGPRPCGPPRPFASSRGGIPLLHCANGRHGWPLGVLGDRLARYGGYVFRQPFAMVSAHYGGPRHVRCCFAHGRARQDLACAGMSSCPPRHACILDSGYPLQGNWLAVASRGLSECPHGDFGACLCVAECIMMVQCNSQVPTDDREPC